jgi:hemerythrin-like metal-binding protein
MVLIEWGEKYCIGIANIDYEHEKLVELINSVYALVENRADKQLIVDSLGDIYGDISAHFALEEKMMRKHSYVHYKEHKADHQRLLKDIGDITERLEKSNELDEPLFKQKLADWFLLHFKTHDIRLHKLVKYSPHDRADEPTMRIMVQNEKNNLLSQTRKQP